MFLDDIVGPMSVEEAKQRLDPKCWKGYKKQGTKVKDGVRVNNCVPKESVAEDAWHDGSNAWSSEHDQWAKESAGEGMLAIGDPVQIVGDVEFKGKTGEVADMGKDGRFVVVNLYNFGKHSFHASDVSYNEYADEKDVEEFWDEPPEVREAKSLTKRVRIVKGSEAGKTGTVGEVRHGAFKGAPKTFTVDIDGGGSIQLPKEALRLLKDQGVAEGSLEANTPDPVVVVQDLKGNILDKLNLSVAAQKYKLGQPQNIKNQLAHQNYTKVGNYTIVSPMSGQPQDATTQGMAEGGFGRDEEFLNRERNAGLEHETNNIQISINGQPWKVVAGKGYADSQEERNYLNNMRKWAEKKSAATGKKWAVTLTGANPTVNELSTEKLAQYKKAAGADASAADKSGDIERGNKRFKGIVKATIKQGDNDAKKHAEQGVAEGWSDAMVSQRTGQPRTPYSVYIKGKKWKDFENDDHARAVMDRLKAKFKADGRDPETITIAPTDIPEGVAETVTDVKAGMAEIYHRLAPGIERHRDSFLAGQLYDELENYAELHGAEAEFKRMLNGARNRAHMDYDTNPGGFQNWFWYLPFDDVAEAKDSNPRDLYRKTQDAGTRNIIDRAYKENPSAKSDIEAITGFVANQQDALDREQAENARQARQIRTLAKDLKDKEKRFQNLNAQIADMPELSAQEKARMAQEIEREVEKDLAQRGAVQQTVQAPAATARPTGPAYNTRTGTPAGSTDKSTAAVGTGISAPAQQPAQPPAQQPAPTTSPAIGQMAAQLSQPQGRVYKAKQSPVQGELPGTNVAQMPSTPAAQQRLQQLAGAGFPTMDAANSGPYKQFAEATSPADLQAIAQHNNQAFSQAWAHSQSTKLYFGDGQWEDLTFKEIEQIVSAIATDYTDQTRPQVWQQLFTDHNYFNAFKKQHLSQLPLPLDTMQEGDVVPFTNNQETVEAYNDAMQIIKQAADSRVPDGRVNMLRQNFASKYQQRFQISQAPDRSYYLLDKQNNQRHRLPNPQNFAIENKNYWTKLQNERNKKITGLISELKNVIGD
jgi:hypothetical protein